MPYLVWGNIHLVIVGFIPGEYRTLSVSVFLKEVFTSDFWFLRCLFVYYFVLWLCNMLLKRIETIFGGAMSHENLCAMIITLCSSALIFVLGRIPYISESVSVWYYLWFVTGWLIYRINRYLKNVGIEIKIKRWIDRKVLSAVALAGIIAAMLLKYTCYLPGKLFAVIFICLIVAFVVGIEQFLPVRIKNFIMQIGSNTLPIYAIHWCLLFSPLWRMGLYTSIFGMFPVWVSSIITFGVWTVLCLVFIRILNKNRVTRRLLLGTGWN